MACAARSRRSKHFKNKEQRTKNKNRAAMLLFSVLCSLFCTLMADTSRDDAYIEDERLLERVAAGDLPALEQLFARYQRQVYQLALGVTRDAETAEEVLQDTFYRLHK